MKPILDPQVSKHFLDFNYINEEKFTILKNVENFNKLI